MADSQPFIGDLNGDYYDDILFNNYGNSTRLSVALLNKTSGEYDIGGFREKMVDPNCGGVESQIDDPVLTNPHSVALIDFDADCMSDLFLTV